MGTVPRVRTEEIEAATLAPWATLAASTKGRERLEDPCPLRTDFQRDRDRILHTKAFRRLMHKTQVFIAPEGDHYRTRLIHTLEVAQVARTICRALRLNEDLVEAICLGHDVGHTPFGHVGEDALGEAMGRLFEHNRQSLRVVDVIEDLNLTWEVRDGILNHTWRMSEPSTPEGMVARWSDRIAYINHDTDDAIRAGILEPQDLPAAARKVLGDAYGDRLNSMVEAVVRESLGAEAIVMPDDVSDAMGELRAFLFERVYLGPARSSERSSLEARGVRGTQRPRSIERSSLEERGVRGTQRPRMEAEHAGLVVRELCSWFRDHPEELPADVRADDVDQRVTDYVSGMTDRFALRAHEARVRA